MEKHFNDNKKKGFFVSLPLYPWRLVSGLNLRFNLRSALIVYVLLPMGVVTAGAAWWSLRAFERQVEKRMQNDLEMVARAIKQPVNHALLREREGSIAQALESAFAMSHVYGAYLYDAEGRKISDTATNDDYDDNIDEKEVSRRAAEGERHGEYGEFGGRDVYSYFVPLTDSGGRITGLLQLTRERSDFHEHIRNIRYNAAGLFLLAFVVLTGLVLFGHHRVFGNHLNRLTRTMTKIAEGNRLHRYLPGGPREIVALGRHFNAMMDNIERAEQEIKNQRNQQKQLEVRLRETEKLAAIGELAAGVAHELGNPLSLIDAKAQRSLRQSDLPESSRQSLEHMRKEVRRMERIILQLRDFSSRNPVKLRSIKVSSLARTSVAAVAHEAEEQTVKLVIGDHQDCQLLVDPMRMEQALVNLLRNAIQAAPGGRVEIGWTSNGNGETALEVKDNGPGIDEQHRSKIFEPFFTTKGVGEGTGLGLAVVHGIAEEHEGRIEVDVNTGEGACFRFVIPNQPDQD